jgi:two-component system response regulator MprA
MAARGASVLVVEDSQAIQLFLSRVLVNGGMTVTTAGDGESAVRSFMAERPDLVLLDVNLPRLDGWGVLAKLRAVDEGVPVLMLTAVQNESSKVRGLLGGADDYVVKPVGAGELLARVTALLRRRRIGAGATLDGDQLALTPLEFRLLAAFVRHAGETLSPTQLMETVWNDYTGTTTDPVKVYVGYVRRKLRGAGDRLETVRGFGYRFVPTQSRRSA